MSEEKKQRLKEYQKGYEKNYHKAKERYFIEKAVEYYAQNKEAIKESQESIIKTCHKKKKIRLKSTKKKVSRIDSI